MDGRMFDGIGCALGCLGGGFFLAGVVVGALVALAVVFTGR